MISPVDASSQYLLAGLERIQDRTERAGRELSSGTRVAEPSDDPDQAALILQLCTMQQRNTQIQTNLKQATSELTTADAALQSGSKLLDRATTLAAQGASTTVTAESRQTLVGEIESLQKSMVGLSQTTFDGRYIFSGDNDQQAAYQYDAATGTVQLQFTQTNTRQVELADGQRVSVSLTASQIFDGTGGSVFAALEQLRQALKNNDQTQIAQAAQTLKDASGYYNQQVGSYGAIERRIQDGLTDAQSQGTRLKAELSTRTDADATEAAVELQQGTLQQQAALTAFAKRPTTSLFNYLG